MCVVWTLTRTDILGTGLDCMTNSDIKNPIGVRATISTTGLVRGNGDYMLYG